MGYKGNLTGDGDWEIVKIDMKYVEGYFWGMDSIGGFLRIMIAEKSRDGQQLSYDANNDSDFAVGSSIHLFVFEFGRFFCAAEKKFGLQQDEVIKNIVWA